MVVLFKNCNLACFAKIAFAALAAALLCACESVKDDARKTPIGGVVSGKTHSVDSYLDQVREQNRGAKKDVWRPMSNERF